MGVEGVSGEDLGDLSIWCKSVDLREIMEILENEKTTSFIERYARFGWSRFST